LTQCGQTSTLLVLELQRGPGAAGTIVCAKVILIDLIIGCQGDDEVNPGWSD